MNYYDQHVHSSFSFDSQTELSDYLKHADGCFVTTEHVDLENSANHFMDSWMDYDRYSLYLENLQKNTDIRLLKGVEIGWLRKHHGRLMAWLQCKQFDIILLSIHQNGIFDYMDEEAKSMISSIFCVLISSRCSMRCAVVFQPMFSVILIMSVAYRMLIPIHFSPLHNRIWRKYFRK